MSPAKRERFDVCAIGHVSRDTIRIGERIERLPGGAAYYLTLTLRCLGRAAAVLTKLAVQDEPELLGELRDQGAAVIALPSPRTTLLENRYDSEDSGRRAQRVSAVAAPFEAPDLGTLRARVFHLGPLTNRDMDEGFVKAVAARGEVSLDAQGLVREVEGGVIVPRPCSHAEESLSHVSVLKVDASEALLLSGESDIDLAARCLAGLGPREVVVTLGDGGALLCCEGRLRHVPAVRVAEPVDPTGCGDTFMAAYLHRRLAGEDPLRAARFATAVAALALQRSGPFRGTSEDAERLLARSR